jgi:hypothetical protein
MEFMVEALFFAGIGHRGCFMRKSTSGLESKARHLHLDKTINICKRTLLGASLRNYNDFRASKYECIQTGAN